MRSMSHQAAKRDSTIDHPNNRETIPKGIHVQYTTSRNSIANSSKAPKGLPSYLPIADYPSARSLRLRIRQQIPALDFEVKTAITGDSPAPGLSTRLNMLVSCLASDVLASLCGSTWMLQAACDALHSP